MQQKTPDRSGVYFLRKIGQPNILMDRVVVMRITLRLLILHVAALASFWIFRVPSFRKVLLRRDCKHELLVTLTAYKNPRLIPNFHRVHPSQ
jgi:hypothetical protein